MKEATVIIGTCQKTKQIFGIRAEKINKDWHFTWAFTMDAQSAKREGYDSTTIRGNILVDTEYPGCPYCKAHGFVHCGSCNKISCWDNRDMSFKCPVCGFRGEISYTSSFDNIEGGAF